MSQNIASRMPDGTSSTQRHWLIVLHQPICRYTEDSEENMRTHTLLLTLGYAEYTYICTYMHLYAQINTHMYIHKNTYISPITQIILELGTGDKDEKSKRLGIFS